MNIHPIVVHFPIALLIVYSMIEIISYISPTWSAKLYTTKTICLWIGALGTIAAMSSGDTAKHLIWLRFPLVKTHETWASATQITYMVIAIYYVIKTIITDNLWGKYWSKYTQQYSSQITMFLSSRWTALVIMIASVVWIGLLTIVGALGGAIVRGTGTGDPVTDWVVTIFVK